MKQWEDRIKERLDGYEMKLPSRDSQAFWDRKAVRERAARRRRSILQAAVGIPAIAAVLMAVIMSIKLLNQQDKQPAPAQYNGLPAEIVQDSEPVQEDIIVEWIDEWIDEEDELIPVPDEEDVYYVVEEQPEFPGGTMAYQDYLKNNLVYPDSCRDNSIQGRVIVAFIVEKDSSISNPEIVKSVNRLFDAEALRLISNMPKWKPGKHKGEVCRVKYMLPVNFRLN